MRSWLHSSSLLFIIQSLGTNFWWLKIFLFSSCFKQFDVYVPGTGCFFDLGIIDFSGSSGFIVCTKLENFRPLLFKYPISEGSNCMSPSLFKSVLQLTDAPAVFPICFCSVIYCLFRVCWSIPRLPMSSSFLFFLSIVLPAVLSFSQDWTLHLQKYEDFLKKFSCVSIIWRCIYDSHLNIFKAFHSWTFLTFLNLFLLIDFSTSFVLNNFWLADRVHLPVCCCVFGHLSFVLCYWGCVSFP